MGIFGRLFTGEPETPNQTRDLAVALCSMPHSRNRAQALDVLRMAHFAQVLHAGEHGAQILPDCFEATAMGPMHRDLYEHIRKELLRPSDAQSVRDAKGRLGMQAIDMLRRSIATLRGMTSAEIISFTHDRNGAWNARFETDAYGKAPISDPNRHALPKRDVFRGPTIHLRDLVAEYHARFASATPPEGDGRRPNAACPADAGRTLL